jgi:hypothetical protein
VHSYWLSSAACAEASTEAHRTPNVTKQMDTARATLLGLDEFLSYKLGDGITPCWFMTCTFLLFLRICRILQGFCHNCV